MKKINVSQPTIVGNEEKYVLNAIRTNQISSKGNYVSLFEDKFAKLHGANYGVACSSGTNALILALRAVGVGSGDEVIVPEFTMVATAWAVSMVGATPVFVDCDLDLNINVNKIEEKITPKTKAIIPVHIYGRKANMDKVLEIAHEYGLRVIEDSAEAHGTPLSGDIACFSLFANKIVTSGEGGVCITNDPYLKAQMDHLRGMAFNKDHTFLHKKLGYNFRMTNLQAAFALGQIEKLPSILKKRKQIEKWYDVGLKKLSNRNDINIMPQRDVLWMYDIKVAFNDRQKLIDFLSNKGIETRVGFKPMSMQPMYRDMYEHLFAYRMSMEIMYLPTYTSMSKWDVEYVCNAIKEYYGKKDKESKATGSRLQPQGTPFKER